MRGVIVPLPPLAVLSLITAASYCRLESPKNLLLHSPKTPVTMVTGPARPGPPGTSNWGPGNYWQRRDFWMDTVTTGWEADDDFPTVPCPNCFGLGANSRACCTRCLGSGLLPAPFNSDRPVDYSHVTVEMGPWTDEATSRG